MLCLSGLLCALMALLYWLRPDSCAAVTFWPPWVWLAPGLLAAGLGASRGTKRLVAAIGLLWLGYLLVFAEEPASLICRRPWPSPDFETARRHGRALRVISLNCAAGSKEAADEVAQYRPDIVLLQESPSRREIERLARQLFGDTSGVVCGVDTSIISHGVAIPHAVSGLLDPFFTEARVRLVSGIEVEVASVHLLPPTVGTDIWSPKHWRQHAENRRARRQQVRQIIRHVESLHRRVPLIIGGDFNAPAGDAVFCLLRPYLHDTFDEGGVGWGNTVINDMPVSRIDQVWASDDLRAAGVVARKTRHSDHRMVISDLRLR